MTRDPDTPAVAYCAPGLKGYAERLLDTSGETYREVYEHPGMAGRTDVILAADPVFPLPPFDPEPGTPAGFRTARRPRPDLAACDVPVCYRAGIGIMIHGPGCTCRTPP